MNSSLRPEKGRLILIGGQADSCMHEFANIAYDNYRVLTHIVILSHASDKPKETAEQTLEFFRGQGSGSVTAILPGRPLDLHDATAVYLTGGDRTTLLERLGEAGRRTLQNFLFLGGNVGAEGNAAAVAGNTANRSGSKDSLEDGLVRSQSLPQCDGIGLTPLLIESDTARRSRFAELLTGMALSAAKVAVGLDDDTALILGGPTHGLVVGRGHAWFLVRSPKFDTNIRNMISVYPATVAGINMSCLSGGQKVLLPKTRLGTTNQATVVIVSHGVTFEFVQTGTPWTSLNFPYC